MSAVTNPPITVCHFTPGPQFCQQCKDPDRLHFHVGPNDRTRVMYLGHNRVSDPIAAMEEHAPEWLPVFNVFPCQHCGVLVVKTIGGVWAAAGRAAGTPCSYEAHDALVGA